LEGGLSGTSDGARIVQLSAFNRPELMQAVGVL